MKEISVSSKETIASQIKGEKQLSDLTDSVQIKSDKFDEYEKDRKAKDELIMKLQMQVTELTEKSVTFLCKLTNRSNIPGEIAF